MVTAEYVSNKPEASSWLLFVRCRNAGQDFRHNLPCTVDLDEAENVCEQYITDTQANLGHGGIFAGKVDGMNPLLARQSH